ncbi:hypothetical protein FSP39_005213 [Pinctada imbricata]|uniref:Large ribosomal subunit protein mL38 n=1 Tax=Pinctada imbricata TaxID=66713 RepID=A0AA88XHN5_PINIB|nr:hypothetical protein FSP39_005213 [Pinctada imbricata]
MCENEDVAHLRLDGYRNVYVRKRTLELKIGNSVLHLRVQLHMCIQGKEKKERIPLEKRTNIGFKWNKQVPNSREVRQTIRKRKEELEQAARFRELSVSVDQVSEKWWREKGPPTITMIAEHYGIFKDLFHDAYFYPSVDLDVCYDFDENHDLPVFCGNHIRADEVRAPPNITYTSDDSSLWTLIMTAPDSHLQKTDAEYLHWMIGNIPGNRLADGEELCNYLPPFPLQGTGAHRYVFILFKQNEKIDFTSEKRPDNCISLDQRTFQTAEFYKHYEDDITPAGISFFQCEYDESVRDVFWDILDMKHPSFEFVHPPPYHPKQKKWPGKQPFDLYLDRYKDVKQINEEVLREKLKTINPFQPKPPRPKYPNVALVDKSTPSWIKLKNKHRRLQELHFKDLD